MNTRTSGATRTWCRGCGAILVTMVLTATAAVAQPPGGGPPGGGAAGPTQVGVIEVTTESVPYTVTVPGRAVAYEQANIRPQVSGVIAEISYTPGRRVEEGNLLFQINDDTYAAAVASADADIASANAELAAAQDKLSRYQQLEGTAVTSADVEDVEVTVSKAQAAVDVADAALEVANIQLERTKITSPIAGFAASPTVSVGDIVTANQADALTTVTRLDPIYVDVEESSARIQRVREEIDTGILQPGDQVEMRLTLENGTAYDKVGEVAVPGALVSTTTGTTDIRVQFDNSERLIMPGQFLRVSATLGTTQAILVPQGATSRASDGTLTAYVVRDGKATEVELDEFGSYNNAWIVTGGGIESGDQLIVDNLSNLRNGDSVEPVPVTISSDGVIEDQTEPTGESGATAGDGSTPPADGSSSANPDQDPGTPSPAPPTEE